MCYVCITCIFSPVKPQIHCSESETNLDRIRLFLLSVLTIDRETVALWKNRSYPIYVECFFLTKNSRFQARSVWRGRLAEGGTETRACSRQPGPTCSQGQNQLVCLLDKTYCFVSCSRKLERTAFKNRKYSIKY
jgi:hypothetical protein